MTVERVDSPLAGRRPGALGPVGGSSALPGVAVPTPLSERSPAPFWLELKGVERWFDTLDPGERLTLLTSLFGRSSETQLRQFSAAIDKSLQTAQYATGSAGSSNPSSFASNLSRFGVGQSAASAPPPEYASLRYHAPMQKQPVSSGTSAGPGPGAPGSVPQSTGAAAVSGSVPAPPPVGASVGGVNPSGGSGSGYMSPLNQPLSAPLANSQNSYTPSSDLYAQAFLPLPRSKSFTPWGPEIRPKSATADAWPDLGSSGRASPQPAQSSPNLAGLSLEQTSASTSPIGHPIKPWRTFTPVGLGQAPEPFDPSRSSRNSQAQSSQPPGHASTTHAGSNSSSGSSVLGNGIAGASHAPPVPPLNMDLNRRSSASQTGPHSATIPSSSSAAFGAPQLGSHIPVPFGSQFVSRSGAQSSSPTASHKLSTSQPPGSTFAASEATPTSAGTGGGSGSGASMSGSRPNASAAVAAATSPTEAGSPTSSLYSLTSGKQSPKRGVNVVDVELLSDIGAWLRSLRLHKYTVNLSGMKWQDVVQLEDADLESRGVNALGARRKLLKMFEEIRQAQDAGLLPGETD